MSGNIVRQVLVICSALALAACGSSHEADLERQLAEAKADAQKEAAARAEAERQATRDEARNAALADFYGEGASDDDAQADAPMDDGDAGDPAIGDEAPQPDIAAAPAPDTGA